MEALERVRAGLGGCKVRLGEWPQVSRASLALSKLPSLPSSVIQRLTHPEAVGYAPGSALSTFRSTVAQYKYNTSHIRIFRFFRSHV